MECPRLIIAGTSSNAGKTMICMGLARELVRRGMKVACFKTGPDFIDSAYLSAASGKEANNLDTWLMSPQYIVEAVEKAGKDADIVLIEGVRSLYDGATPLGDEGSTAHLAKILSAPVVLALNARSLARGAAAVALGFSRLDPDIDVRGFILNMIKGPSHSLKASVAIKSLAGKEVFGAIPRDSTLTTQMRHLGLVTVLENDHHEVHINRSADVVAKCIDVDRLLEIARSAPTIESQKEHRPSTTKRSFTACIAHDTAFSFLYPSTISALRAQGAEINVISPIADSSIPENTDILMICGGFPECYADSLSSNSVFMKDVLHKSEDGMPIFAECGGLMYLGSGLTDLDGKRWAMTGLFDAESEICKTCQSVSYTILKAERASILSETGVIMRGHEFHYSSFTPSNNDMRYAFSVERGKGIDGQHEGIMEYNTVAQYSHMHLDSLPEVASSLASSAIAYSKT